MSELGFGVFRNGCPLKCEEALCEEVLLPVSIEEGYNGDLSAAETPVGLSELGFGVFCDLQILALEDELCEEPLLFIAERYGGEVSAVEPPAA